MEAAGGDGEAASRLSSDGGVTACSLTGALTGVLAVVCVLASTGWDAGLGRDKGCATRAGLAWTMGVAGGGLGVLAGTGGGDAISTVTVPSVGWGFDAEGQLSQMTTAVACSSSAAPWPSQPRRVVRIEGGNVE